MAHWLLLWKKKSSQPGEKNGTLKSHEMNTRALSRLANGKHYLQKRNSYTSLLQCQKYDLQLNFPGKPNFERAPVMTLNHAELQRLGSIWDVLKEINHSFQQEFKNSFTDSLIQHGGAGLQKNPTSTERKNNKSIQSTDKENQSLTSKTPLVVLRFYNTTWLHHELCRKLFLQFHAGMTRKRFFTCFGGPCPYTVWTCFTEINKHRKLRKIFQPGKEKCYSCF